MAMDPVCKMRIKPEYAAMATMDYKGKKYYFCSEHCHEQFKADPEKYLNEEDDSFLNPRHKP